MVGACEDQVRAGVEPGRDLRASGQALEEGEQAVVAGGGEGIGQPPEHPAAAVVHR